MCDLHCLQSKCHFSFCFVLFCFLFLFFVFVFVTRKRNAAKYDYRMNDIVWCRTDSIKNWVLTSHLVLFGITILGVL